MNNIFSDIPDDLPDELPETLLDADSVRIRCPPWFHPGLPLTENP